MTKHERNIKLKNVALEQAYKKLKNSRIKKQVDFKFANKLNSFYFTFHKYGAELRFSIFKDGNIQFSIKDVTVGETQFFYYLCNKAEFDEKETEGFAKIFRDDIKMLISDFLEDRVDYRVVAETLSGATHENWKAKYVAIRR